MILSLFIFIIVSALCILYGSVCDDNTNRHCCGKAIARREAEITLAKDPIPKSDSLRSKRPVFWPSQS